VIEDAKMQLKQFRFNIAEANMNTCRRLTSYVVGMRIIWS